MDLIRPFLDYEKCQKISTQVGRVCHMIKAKCQGRTYLSHPEFYSIDVISGEIEGTVRGFKSNLKMNWEVRPLLMNMIRASQFMAKVLKSEFFNDSKIEKPIVEETKGLIQFVVDASKALERELTIASIKQSNDMTGEDIPITPSIQLHELVKNPFEDMNGLDGQSVDKVSSVEDIHKVLQRVAEMLGHKAHSTQEEVTEYLHIPDLKKFANEIINKNGGNENESRRRRSY